MAVMKGAFQLFVPAKLHQICEQPILKAGRDDAFRQFRWSKLTERETAPSSRFCPTIRLWTRMDASGNVHRAEVRGL